MKPVSYSGLSTYAKCPSAFKRRYITQEEVAEGVGPSPAALRGSAIHKCIEEFLLKESNDLADEVSFYDEFFTDLRENATLKAEHRWAFDHAWECTSFNDPTAILRGVTDAVVQDGMVVYVYEFKTGKRYEEHAQQRALYGLAALLTHPMAEEAEVFTMYLDDRSHEHANFNRQQLGAYKWMWRSKVARVWEEQDYPETPSWKCKYCPYSESRGGSCPN